jgi:hypothetical protein
MPNRTIHKVWTFKSSSSDKTYETLLYSDGSTSCDCPGWTRRAIRSCRHTRAVDLGTADAEATNCHDYTTGKKMLHTGEMIAPANRQSAIGNRKSPTYAQRKLCL